jgi:hypothetical protein
VFIAREMLPAVMVWLAVALVVKVACVPIPTRPKPPTLSAPETARVFKDRNLIVVISFD